MNNQKSISSKNFNNKKSLGQCFLKDDNVVKKIVSLSRPNKDTSVIEVGPGLGAMTKELLNSYKEVIAYEIDKDAISYLKNKFENKELTIIEGDVLDKDIDNNISKINNEVISISNLPYYITSPIIDKFMKTTSVKRMYFMVQKEVADRLSATVGTKDYNAFSVALQYKANIKTILKVSRKCFMPEPNVDSAVIEIIKDDTKSKAKDDNFFYKIVYASFKERRKTLLNNLEKFLNINKCDVEEGLLEIDISASRRAETLSIEEFIKISDHFGGAI